MKLADVAVVSGRSYIPSIHDLYYRLEIMIFVLFEFLIYFVAAELLFLISKIVLFLFNSNLQVEKFKIYRR